MLDFTKLLPPHIEKYVGENDLFLEIYPGTESKYREGRRPPLLFVHGAYTGSWMWSKFLPHFIGEGWSCYAMNLRSHYKSRVMDMTRITFEDYLEDIKLVIAEINAEYGCPPVLIGFSLGGILCQKIAESETLEGMVLIDSSVCREVYERVPYGAPVENNLGMIVPAPDREEQNSIDESEEDILFQRKYLATEASKVFLACGCWMKGATGISVDSSLIHCPTLVIRVVNNEEDERRLRAEAEYYHGDYAGFSDATHTGLLIGQRYRRTVDRILSWLEQLSC